MADLLTDLTTLSSKAVKSKKDKIKVVSDFMVSDEYVKGEFKMSELHAKLLVLGDIKVLRDMERGIYAN